MHQVPSGGVSTVRCTAVSGRSARPLLLRVSPESAVVLTTQQRLVRGTGMKNANDSGGHRVVGHVFPGVVRVAVVCVLVLLLLLSGGTERVQLRLPEADSLAASDCGGSFGVAEVPESQFGGSVAARYCAVRTGEKTDPDSMKKRNGPEG